MKVLILYAGKTGTTEKCAKILKALVDDSVTCDLTKGTESIDLRDYDCIIVGGSIRSGKMHKDAREFIKDHKDLLMKKRCAFFICNCFKDQSEKYLRNNIPAPLLDKALAAASFGGEINPDKFKRMDRIAIKAIGGLIKDLEVTQLYTSSEAIQRFAEKIKR